MTSFNKNLQGKIPINPPFNTFKNQNLIEKVIAKVFDSLRSNLPTRIILLIPISFERQVGHLYETQARNSRFLEIATFPKGSLVAPQHYHIHNNFRPGFFAGKVGLYLCANKASLQIDPVDWNAMSRELMAWSQENTKFPPTLNDITSQKFAQRVIPSHSPRSFNIDITFTPSSNFFHYYDFALLPENEAQTMRTYVPNPDHLELLSKINQHDRLAGTLGILPNHLIQLLRLTNPEDSTKVIHDLRLPLAKLEYGVNAKRYIECIGILYLNVADLKPNQRKLILQEKTKTKKKKDLH